MGGLLSKDSLGSFLSLGQNHGVHFLGAKGLGSLATILLLVGLERLLDHHLLELVAVLLIHVITGLLGLVGAAQPLLGVTQRLDGFLLTLIADLPGLLLAVLGVAVLLCLLGASLHLQLADLLGLEMAVLLLHWEGEDV